MNSLTDLENAFSLFPTVLFSDDEFDGDAIESVNYSEETVNKKQP